MEVWLVLLTGLPGAGKSTLARALQRQRSVAGEPSRLSIEAVVELDDFIIAAGAVEDGGSDTLVKSTLFTPQRWREAYVESRSAIHRELRRCLTVDEGSNGRLRLVFFVDPLPYRSMRESYWKLCNEVSRECGELRCVQAPERLNRVLMLEVRLNTPVDVCLRRNEFRSGTPQYVPPYVIKGISDSFDIGDLSKSVVLGGGSVWAMLPHRKSTPWPVLLLADEVQHCNDSSETLSDHLIECIFRQELMNEMSQQRNLVSNVEREQQKRDGLARSPTNERKCDSSGLLHQIDLHMRAVVRHFILHQSRYGTLPSNIGKKASKCRAEYYAKIRTSLGGGLEDRTISPDVEGYVHQELLDFERCLESL
uniref:Uncharacterized protein n=1 Tax=Trypanosoma congolense (strain IL3000) TaxID=1068625 RepID=G0UXB3_TRYCI|nr:conserved hypothetical protein [Trypanosoma congolense IL3000]